LKRLKQARNFSFIGHDTREIGGNFIWGDWANIKIPLKETRLGLHN
jgi:hypothetical protein